MHPENWTPQNPQVSREQGIRINHYIDCNEIRLIGSQGENIGLVNPQRGIELANEEEYQFSGLITTNTVWSERKRNNVGRIMRNEFQPPSKPKCN